MFLDVVVPRVTRVALGSTGERERMSRNGVLVRSATADDASALAALWADEDRAPSSASEAATALEFNSSVNGHQISVALVDGELAGALVHQITTVNPVSATKTLRLVELRIPESRRKRATELALLGHVAELAHGLGCEFVAASAPAADRDAHRMLTRLGFTQASIERSVAVSRLLARVSASSQPAARGTGRLVAVRRTMRRREDARSSTPHPSN